MKRILLLLTWTTVFMGFGSCSDEPGETTNPPSEQSSLTVTVDGVEKSFPNVSVSQGIFLTGEESIPTYNVLANSEEDNGEFIAFQVRQDYTGTEGLYTFIYNDDMGNHTLIDSFVMNITTNTTEKLTGSFSGSLFQDEEAEPSVNITAGSFNINYDF